MSDAPAPTAPLKLFNSLTRQLEEFQPVHIGEARVYSCGPTVYNYPHIGNMRAYVFADVLGRTLSFKGYKLTHVINITDVGHLTDDADAGEDKMEKMARAEAKSIWDIAQHYTQAYWEDIKALNIRQPARWTIATEFVPQMIEFATRIANKHCYELDSGLYFDVSTVENYGRLSGINAELAIELRDLSRRLRESSQKFHDSANLSAIIYQEVDRFVSVLQRLKAESSAKDKYQDFIDLWLRTPTPEHPRFNDNFSAVLAQVREFLATSKVEGRIEEVEGKRNEEDFAIWRKTPPGEKRQMEWDSPWGRGAPGWHLECSVMSGEVLGFPFDIHTGGIDHREIHHPNEIAQNQAFCCAGGLDLPANSGARVWMHNNFLVERSGKMSKSSGEFLRLQLLIDKGYHPLAYRMMCLQAHYRSELEFSWEGLAAALTRLKRMLMAIANLKSRHAELVSASISDPAPWLRDEEWTLKQVQGDGLNVFQDLAINFDEAISSDLNTSVALTLLEDVLAKKKVDPAKKLQVVQVLDAVLGLNLLRLERADLRIRPKDVEITEAEIEAALSARKEARAVKDFARSDALRDELAAKGVEVMDGDPLGWDWKLG